MRVVVALGGNALLRRGEPLTAENQRANAQAACAALAPVALEHELVISHGNGPQVGLLALQGSAYTAVEAYPLDVLGAQTEGMIGYLIEQELGNLLPQERPLATLLTMIEVDGDDPAFGDPTKPIGPVYDRGRGRPRSRPRRAGRSSRTATASGASSPRPLPKRIFEIEPISALLEQGASSSAPAAAASRRMYTDEPVPAGRRLVGVEAVIDKDLASALLAIDLDADVLADRHRRRRRLRRLGHAGAAADPPRRRRRARGDGLRGGLDGAEGARRLRVRRGDRQAGRDRLDDGHACAAARRGRDDDHSRCGRRRDRSAAEKRRPRWQQPNNPPS